MYFNILKIIYILGLTLILSIIYPPWLFSVFAKINNDAEYQRMRVFAEVLTEIEHKYIDKKTPEELITEALKGMVNSLDPYSTYLTQDEFKDLQIETKGSFHGVGIEITLKDDFLTVVSPIEDSPAFLAGIKSGDRIIKIDGKLTKGMSLHDAIKSIRGTNGSKIILTTIHEGSQKLNDIIIARDIIPIHSVRYFLLEDGLGYIRISSFQEDTTQELIKGLQLLQGQIIPLRGLILDLRNNPGGLLQEAINVADQFIKNDVIVSTKGRQTDQQIIFKASGQGKANDYPIICLVNNGSASASEIVAGALQDHKRAIILGTTTFGKGSVQTIFPLEDKGALRLTTAHYYTPNGRIIQAKGIAPDLVLEFESLEIKKNNFFKNGPSIHEKKLNTKISIEEKPKDKQFKHTENIDKLYMPSEKLSQDNQLRRAIDIFKSLQFNNLKENTLPYIYSNANITR